MTGTEVVGDASARVRSGAGPEHGADGGDRVDDLGGLAGHLRRHWPVAAATFVVVVLLALASPWVLGSPYRAQSEVLLRTEESQQLFAPAAAVPGGGLVRVPGAELEYTRSDSFRDRARAAAGNDLDVEVRRPAGGRSSLLGDDGSSILSFVAEGDEAASAAATANAWAEAYVRVRHEIDVEQTEALVAQLIAARGAVEGQRDAVLAPVAALDAAIAEATDPALTSRLVNQRLAVERSLADELDPIKAELRAVDAQLAAANADARLLEDPGAQALLSVRAEEPAAPVGGSLLRNLLVGVVAGIALALAAVAVVGQRSVRAGPG